MLLLGHEITLAAPCSLTPESDGYRVQAGPLPYHVHPEATPEAWADLSAAIIAGTVAVSAFVPPVTDPALALAQLRAERDRRLAACDFTQLPDAPLSQSQKSAWAAYRQQLRDLPETLTDPAIVAWPGEPGDLPDDDS